MDIAIEKYAIGNVRKVTAISLEKKGIDTIHLSEKRFFCTECGEYVGFSNSERKAPYFYHGKALYDALICDLRVDINGDYSIYEKLGSQLYINNIGDNLFNIKVGFYSLKDSLLHICSEKKYSITIESEEDNNKVKYCINESRFISGSKTYLDINFFARKYQINYSSSEAKNLLKKNWGNSINGFQNSCVLFSCHYEGGKKINVNEEIEINTDFYLVCSTIPYQLKRYIKIELTGKMEFLLASKIKKMNVYKLQFIAKSDYEFIHLHDFIRSFFKLSLVKKAKKIIILWPPCIELFEESIFINNYKKTALILNSTENNLTLYSHINNYSIQKSADAVGKRFSLFEIDLYTSDNALSINGEYSPINRVLKLCKKGYLNYKNIIFSIYDDKTLISEKIVRKMPCDKSIKVIANSKIEIIHYKSDIVYSSYSIQDNNGAIINNLEFNDKVVARLGFKEIILFKLQKGEESKCALKNDANILNQIKKNNNGKFVPVPVWVKVYIVKLSKNSELKFLIKKYISINKIPVNIIKVLKSNQNIWEEKNE